MGITGNSGAPNNLTFTYTWDGLGDLSTLVNPSGETSSYTYGPAGGNGWLSQATFENSSSALVASTLYTYDAQGRITNLADDSSTGTTLGSYTVASSGGYDGVGDLTSVDVNFPSP
jgi:uncharacterized protein RhaS with RHS repeats